MNLICSRQTTKTIWRTRHLKCDAAFHRLIWTTYDQIYALSANLQTHTQHNIWLKVVDRRLILIYGQICPLKIHRIFCIVQKQHQKKPVTEAEEARGPRCACGDSIMIENGIPMRVFSFGNGGCGTSLTATMSVTFNGPLHDHIPKRAKYAWTRTQHKQPQQQRHWTLTQIPKKNDSMGTFCKTLDKHHHKESISKDAIAKLWGTSGLEICHL